jgi:hypothetical protein
MRNASSIFIGIFVILFFGGLVYTCTGRQNKQTFIAKVTDKERITDQSGKTVNSYYLIFTDKGTFKLEDDLFYGNFNSSDWYGQIQKDSTYTFHTIGYRSGFLSMYPNIVKFEHGSK